MTSTIQRPSQHISLAVCFAVIFGHVAQISRADEHRAIPSHTEVFLAGLKSSELEDKLHGLVLLEELNCAACHAPDGALAARSKIAPRLLSIGSRVNPYYLEKFIQDPRGVKPGTTMPDVMTHLKQQERQKTAQEITHYLLSLNKQLPSFELQEVDAVAAEVGEGLFHSVGCVACHSPRNAEGEEIMDDSSVPLGALEHKYNTGSLADFLRAPHKTRPSGRMPDMKLDGRAAEQIAHYLLRKTEIPGHLRYTLLRGRVWEGLEENVTREKAGLVKDFSLTSLPQVPGNSAIVYEGFLHIAAAGEYSFYLEMNGGKLALNDVVVADLPPSSRRGVKQIETKQKLPVGWNKLRLTYIHAGNEPKLSFEMAGLNGKRQAIEATSLSISQTPVAPFRPYAVDETLAARGKIRFTELGCVQCHNDVPHDADSLKTFGPLAKLDPARGCLSAEKGSWAHFQLSIAQQDLVRPLLKQIETTKLDEEQIVNKSLVTFNCIACHQRDNLGGISLKRNAYFVGTKGELGNEGRIPPPLTHVGAKLQNSWIKQVMLHGQEQRKYLATKMPQFGEANIGHLVNLFEKVDKLEEVAFDKVEDENRYKSAGHQLVGTTGFSCIACHDFNGQQASGPGAMDIIHSTERLKKDWFYLFLLDPARFHPNTIMPSAWPGGHAFKKDILDGDSKRQIESIWIYLEDGVRAKNPIGLSRKSPELRVTDETLISRGRGNAGYRGIAVGYPERLNLAFDSQEMNLRLLWKGRFVTAGPSTFSAIGDERIEFQQGIPFHRLKSLDDNWPYKRKTDYLFPQDHGYQFGGYYLGPQKRPTFMYRYSDVRIEEYFEDVLDEKQTAYFRRTFTFDAPRAQEKFYFRAATGKEIARRDVKSDNARQTEDADQTSFTADRLHITIVGSQQGIVREGDPKELLIPLELPPGKSKLVLEYRW